jgi:hypothetical protein
MKTEIVGKERSKEKINREILIYHFAIAHNPFIEL